MLRTLRLGVAAATLLLMVAACTAPAPTRIPTPAASPPPPGLSGDLAIWQTYGSGAAGVDRGEPAALNAALDVVRAENPGLNLTVTEVGLGDLFNSYRLLAADGVPDLFLAPNSNSGDIARNGLALDLTSRFTAAERGRYSELALAGSTVDGKWIQVPESVKAVAIYYDTAKIPMFPTTTSDLLARVQDGSIRLGLFQGIYHTFGFWGSFGGRLMDGSGRCIADESGTADAFAYYAALKDAGASWYAGGSGYAEAMAAFNSLEVDAVIDGPWSSVSYMQTHPGNLGVAPLPAGPGGPALPLTGVDGWTINPNSHNLDLAVAFAKRMTQPDILKIFADLAVHIPADTSVSSSDPLAEEFAAALTTGTPQPLSPQMSAFWGSFGGALDRVVDEGVDPATAVSEACATMNSNNGL